MSTRSLPRLVQGLLDPGAFPHPAAAVELVQTHISYVFLAGAHAYKVKKPLRLGFLDYASLDRREYFCRREVELNLRLCPNLYLDVAPIVETGAGPRVGGDGSPIEWCVIMRRLPEDRLLSHLLPDRVSVAQIDAIARKLAAFHADAATGGEIDRFGEPSRVRDNTEENFRQLRPFIGRTLSADQHARIRAYTERVLVEQAPLFARRIAEGRIRDGHGDVHAASVCLADDVLIFDCIEFNDRFRYGDVASDVAFLAMDLTHVGRADLAERFVATYRSASGDPLPPELVRFYSCYRATVRAKVESFQLEEAEVAPDDKAAARQRARSYADLAELYASQAEGQR